MEALLRVPASAVVLPGIAMSGWVTKQSDWLKSWNRRWMVLWPAAHPIGATADKEKGQNGGIGTAELAHGWWLFFFTSPTASKPRRVVPLRPGEFDLDFVEEEVTGSGGATVGKRAVLELEVRSALSSTLLPGRVQDGTTKLRLHAESRRTMRVWARAIADIVEPVRRGRLDSAGCSHRAPLTRFSRSISRSSSNAEEEAERRTWARLEKQLASPAQSKASVAGPGHSATVRLPALDFEQQDQPCSPPAPAAESPSDAAAAAVERRPSSERAAGSAAKKRRRRAPMSPIQANLK